jgi:para-nitrobenzyl esterase
VEDLRFRAPQPPAAWDGVRDATALGASSLQVANEALNAILPSGEEAQSEDCLYLNIWTPAVDGARRPVMVWIHGGAFTIGSGSSPMYGGQRLAERGDAVIVTINYRLGALGFLCLDDPGDGGPFTNFGMLDQVAALRWVRDEIAAFGGDPGNITIFGESAGAMSVGALMGSPLAAGLFRRAIPESGAGHNALTLEQARANAAAFAELAGVERPTRAALAKLAPETILAAQGQLEAETMATMGAGLPPEMAFQPVIDGHFLAQRPVDAVRGGLSAGVSLLIGTNAEESRLFTAMVPDAANPSDQALVHAFAARLTSPDDEETGRDAVRVYRQAREARGESATPGDLYVAADTDFMFAIPADRLATAQAAHQPQTFVYRFDWKSPMAGGMLGACHALEIPFVFGSLDIPGINAFAGEGPAAERLSETIMDAWLGFARSGDPSTSALPWPAFDATSRRTMVLDATCRIEERPHDIERQCWEGRR